jgi:hypothetical protein
MVVSSFSKWFARLFPAEFRIPHLLISVRAAKQFLKSKVEKTVAE